MAPALDVAAGVARLARSMWRIWRRRTPTARLWRGALLPRGVTRLRMTGVLGVEAGWLLHGPEVAALGAP